MAAPHKFLRNRHDMNDRFAAMDTKFAEVEAKAAQRHAEVVQRFADMTKWLLGFWVLSLVTYVGAVVALASGH